MLSIQTRNRTDFFAVIYFMVKILHRSLEAERNDTEMRMESIIDREMFGSGEYDKIFDPIINNVNLPIVNPRPCTNDPECSGCMSGNCTWHYDAALDALSAWSNSTDNGMDELTEDDGVNSGKLRKLIPYIFDEIGKHYGYSGTNGAYGSTVRDDCTREFNLGSNYGSGNDVDKLYELFLRGLTTSKVNPITLELENHLTRDETPADLHNYIKSIGKCIRDWLLI